MAIPIEGPKHERREILLARDVRDLFRSLIRIHILGFAVEGEVYGLAVRDRLQRFGYPVSPGILYPVLHDLERKGLLAGRWDRTHGRARRYYRITKKGRRFLSYMKPFLEELARAIPSPESETRVKERGQI